MTREQITAIFDSGLEAVLVLTLGLLEKIATLQKENEALREKVASLEKDSTNSSKPPSSDGPKKERGSPKRGSSGRKRGGPKGHVGKTREPAPPDKIQDTVDHKPSECEHCHQPFSGTEPTHAVETRQVLEIPTIEPFVTSFPHNAKLNWLWAFVTSTFVFFTIQASRGSKVLREVLGEAFKGIIICDRFSAYVKFHKDRACGHIQYCWAHLIRDVKALKYAEAACGKGVFSRLARQRIGALFRLWHAFKRGHLAREALIEKAQPRIAEMRALWEENLESPSKPVRTLCKGMLDKWDSLFTFIYHEGVEPTNNLAERMLRHGVQTRKSSYCTRSEQGQLMLARFFTVVGTCRLQGRSAFEFLVETIHAERYGLTSPSLLANAN